jgi:hypothetical protein
MVLAVAPRSTRSIIVFKLLKQCPCRGGEYAFAFGI